MDHIIKVPGNKLTPKQLAIVVSLGNLLHDQQRKYSDIPQTQEQRAQRLKQNKKWYKQEDKLSHIYYKDKSPVGMLVQAPDKRDKNISYIGSLFVRPQHRGTGIGKRLLDSAQEEARKQKVKKLLLQYYAGNPAEHLYTRQGFKPGPAQITAVKALQKQASKTISFPQAQLLAVADDDRAQDTPDQVWGKTLSYHIHGDQKDKTPKQLMEFMLLRLTPQHRMPQLKYYKQKFFTRHKPFTDWINALNQEQTAKRIANYKKEKGLE